MKLVCLIFVACLSSCLAAQPQKLTNIDYLGMGYDALLGDPHADLKDPGFKYPVASLSYSMVQFFSPFILIH
jgi:hypothetical protein